MNSWKWNELEEQALDELNNAHAEKLYLRGLRKRMDYSTGLVGATRESRVKMDWLVWLMHEEVSAGSQRVPYVASPDSVRWLLTLLERAGLVERLRKKRRNDSMIFRLPLASTGLVRPQEEHRRSPEQEPRTNNHRFRGLPGEERRTVFTEERSNTGISGITTTGDNKIYLDGAVDKFFSGPEYSPMSREWKVDQGALDYLCMEYGFDESFLRQRSEDFRIYWLERGGGCSSWSVRFVEHVRYQLLNRRDPEFRMAARLRV
ncbi:hypothetical protein HBA55_34965 [Pseudomaricurvus alkylphenolicus]|uniref:DnaT-like ssDNA-binding domain-containing protein n=1 Tax=Pseudomaricurvus alkylphenolicus TaxID=1306991 RepID=UPI00141F74C4|nr:DnaT-like ssDNA-binding domain-containing protein [Pseudomaricurvus alkylphenolicus]NIB44835.1 hypothetical protein [Pseudomaricurvus alkylphenolicus]